MSGARIEVVRADITRLSVDAIVNAANSALIPGGGVDGAINRAAGPELAKAMRAIGGCETGEAVITPAFKLNAKFVIHTVAPVYAQHSEKEVWRLLGDCYRKCLELAAEHGAQSIAFPALGTGVFGIPVAPAARIAVGEALKHRIPPSRVIFCCFSEVDAEIYRTVPC
jgi:O-acetyl-ADP-ribose deacetylase (regulator of RNase III)